MDEKYARAVIDIFDDLSMPKDSDIYNYIEALQYMIDKTQDPYYMMRLGGQYYYMKDFYNALKYYNMAADLDYIDAYECLGYIYYYGRVGDCDYKKAYHYFVKAANAGSLVSNYKVADMYKNGYYVDKDLDIYKRIIEKLYIKVKDLCDPHAPIPEIFIRLAGIRIDESKKKEALSLLLNAKEYMAQRIAEFPFFGNITIMKNIIKEIYSIEELNYECIDLYDCFEVLKTPQKIKFDYHNETYTIKSLYENDHIIVYFNNHWYKSIADFITHAHINQQLLTCLYDELGIMKVMHK